MSHGVREGTPSCPWHPSPGCAQLAGCSDQRKGSAAPPLTISVLPTGTCTTTGSKAWEPTALMGCTAWKPCECPVLLCPKDVGCAHPSAQHAAKGLSPTGVTAPCARSAGVNAQGVLLGFPPVAVLLLQGELCMWAVWMARGPEALDTILVLGQSQELGCIPYSGNVSPSSAHGPGPKASPTPDHQSKELA